eukprot:3381822-Pleurochrysis_carterae.AAC.1
MVSYIESDVNGPQCSIRLSTSGRKSEPSLTWMDSRAETPSFRLTALAVATVIPRESAERQ